MLDGLLGRSGFYSKSKSLIKQTRTRIEVVRRKRNATQKFLREDIADLLANGLETNAFGRAEGLLTELILTSCYDFIDHVCEIILKHLPVLQKLRECPEDCREAIASIMYAAARFSDLPELRELRDLFQERYGSGLEHFVNQKLMENINRKATSKEKKVQLIQEIASEFGIPWDSRGFEERMSNPPAAERNKKRIPTIHATENKIRAAFAEETVHKAVNDEAFTKKRSEAAYQKKEKEVDHRHQNEARREVNVVGRKDDLKHNISRGPEPTAERYKPPSFREETFQKREDNDTYFHRREPKAHRFDSDGTRAPEVVKIGASSHGNRSDKQREDNIPARNGKKFPTVENEVAEDIQAKSTRKRQEDLKKDGLKSNFRSAIPPPYVKPSKNKHKAEENDTLTFRAASNGKTSPHHQNGVTVPENEDGPGRFTETYYKDEFSTPKRRSHRKKHSRSKSTQIDKLDVELGQEEGEERVIRRVSTSRRKHESRKGLQILFDDEHFKKDEEEKMIDKLLLHYSKKPSSADPKKSRRKNKNERKDSTNAIKSPNHRLEDGETRVDDNSTPTTSRSMSLPPLLVTEPEPKKVFTRAASFQPDTPAKHVHPKLPDYDDLAATFAALRASKD